MQRMSKMNLIKPSQSLKFRVSTPEDIPLLNRLIREGK